MAGIVGVARGGAGAPQGEKIFWPNKGRFKGETMGPLPPVKILPLPVAPNEIYDKA